MPLQHRILVAALLAGCAPAQAATQAADPSTLTAQIVRARPGDTLRLAPGSYDIIRIAGRSWAPPLIIDGHGATIKGIALNQVDGITFDGGTIDNTGERTRGVDLVKSRHIKVTNMTVTGVFKGVVMAESQDIAITHVKFTGVRSDGINIALSQRVLIDSNVCTDFHPIKAVFDAAGVRLRDGDHPDCIQAWSRPTAPPTADLTITNNRVDGDMQGIGLYNHVRDGVDDGGFDRVVITGNVLRVGYPVGIALGSARNSVMRDNSAVAIPGSVLPSNGRKVNANIHQVDGTNNIVCGNTLPDVPRAPEAQPCR